MRTAIRVLLASMVMGLVLVLGTGVKAHSNALAANVHVVMYDNEGTFAPGDAETGEWGFFPQKTIVVKGDVLVFENPAGKVRPGLAGKLLLK